MDTIPTHIRGTDGMGSSRPVRFTALVVALGVSIGLSGADAANRLVRMFSAMASVGSGGNASVAIGLTEVSRPLLAVFFTVFLAMVGAALWHGLLPMTPPSRQSLAILAIALAICFFPALLLWRAESLTVLVLSSTGGGNARKLSHSNARKLSHSERVEV